LTPQAKNTIIGPETGSLGRQVRIAELVEHFAKAKDSAAQTIEPLPSFQLLHPFQKAKEIQ
jgi:hypothetical protein